MNDMPGNPSPMELAEADRKMAAVRDVVDKLLIDTHGITANTVGAQVRLAHGPIIDAVIAVQDAVDSDDAVSAAFAIAGELLRRLIPQGSEQS